MKRMKRFVIIVIIVALAAVIGMKWWVRSERGREWVENRLSSVLAMPAVCDSADLVWPGLLSLRNVVVTPSPDSEENRLVAYEVRLGLRWRGGRRIVQIRRPEITFRPDGDGGLPPGWVLLGRMETLPEREAFERASRCFREKWDLSIRDGRVKAMDSSGKTKVVLPGVDWECSRIRIADHRGWHNRVAWIDWREEGGIAAEPVTMEWLSLKGLEPVSLRAENPGVLSGTEPAPGVSEEPVRENISPAEERDITESGAVKHSEEEPPAAAEVHLGTLPEE